MNKRISDIDDKEAIELRHSVRNYIDRDIEEDKIEAL